MPNRTDHHAHPADLDGVPLAEVVAAQAGHLGELERDRAGTGELHGTQAHR